MKPLKETIIDTLQKMVYKQKKLKVFIFNFHLSLKKGTQSLTVSLCMAVSN